MPIFYGFASLLLRLCDVFIIVLFIILDQWKIIEEKTAEITVLVVSILGIIFSGYFTLQELPTLFSKGFGAYFFGLPICTLGLVIYIAIFIPALIVFVQNNIKKNI
ncbi:MAG: hypothetical protein EXS59_02125 [Candidatus Taylorbacteria bacterium]|nr:hypothetical protein [Candidatus Taylorbacteria bacterium]